MVPSSYSPTRSSAPDSQPTNPALITSHPLPWRPDSQTEHSTPERSSFLPLPPRLRPQKGMGVKENIMGVEPNTAWNAAGTSLAGQKRKWGQHAIGTNGVASTPLPPTPPKSGGRRQPSPIAMGWVREVINQVASPTADAVSLAPMPKQPRKRAQPHPAVGSLARSRICLACDLGRKRRCTCGKRTRSW